MPSAAGGRGCVLVPVRGFSRSLGKTRLAPALSPEERAALVARMAGRVVATAASVAPVFILTREPPPPAVAARASGVIDDIGRGLNRELEAASDALLERWGRLLVLPGDVPLVAAPRLRAALSLLGRFDVVLAPSRDGGTALAGLRSPRRMALHFGEAASCGVHRRAARAAGLSVRVQREPLLDVDTPDDVAALGWHP